MIPQSYADVTDCIDVMSRYISHKITDIIKLNYSQKLNVLNFLWTAETSAFKLIIGMWLQQHLSSCCWCVFVSLAKSEDLKIQLNRQVRPKCETIASGAGVWRRWLCSCCPPPPPPPALPRTAECCMGRSIGFSPELPLTSCCQSCQSPASGTCSWEHPSFPPSLQPSPDSPSGADAGSDFPADVHPFFLSLCCSRSTDPAAAANFSLLPGSSEAISDGCAGTFFCTAFKKVTCVLEGLEKARESSLG